MKKYFLKYFIFLLIFQSCYVGRFVVYNFADIKDYKKFPSKPLHRSNTPFQYVEIKGNESVRLPKTRNGKEEQPFEYHLQKSGTVAFTIIRNDTVIYDWVRPKYDQKSIVPSFSMAKSFISALIGIAIDEGKIKNVSEPITNYIAYLDKNTFGKITIQHLLDMESGIKFGESYISPFSDVAKYYYGTNLKKYLKKIKIKEVPGKTFEYMSLNTQLLALILENAIGQSPTGYLQEKIWTPLGMEYDASWSIDSKKRNTEKAFCCINATSRDFAKFGSLYLHGGKWNGQQIISEDWVKKSTTVTENNTTFWYTNQWWHTVDYHPISDTTNLKEPFRTFISNNKKSVSYATTPSGDFYADGHLGQYIYVNPKYNIVIVRLGKKPGKVYWPQVMRDIAKANKP